MGLSLHNSRLQAYRRLKGYRPSGGAEQPGIAGTICGHHPKALEKGVWSAPTFIVDEQLLCGEDRLDQLDLWLERGGW